MRKSHSWRTVIGAVGLGAALAVGGGCDAARAHTSAAGVWVQVSPGTIEAGNNVTVRADCGDNSNPATVSSKAFRTLTLEPWNTLLQGEASVPVSVESGTYDVRLTCRTGSTATTTLSVISAGHKTQPTLGPHTGGGFLAGSSGSATEQGEAPRLWLIAGLTALVAAGAVGIATLQRGHRRRRAPVRNR